MEYKGQEALLHWCKANTSGYPEVLVQNFHSSWKDGLAMCALIHKFHPEVVQFDSLSKDKPLDNLEVALTLAAQLGIPRLFEAADMMIEPRPDQRSVMTYLSQMFHVFERNANPGMGIANITFVGPNIPTLSTTPSENNLIQHQVSAKPKFSRSLSTSNLPKPLNAGPQLQQRIPPLLTKSGTFKYTPIKKAAAQVPAEQQTPVSEQPPPPSVEQAPPPTQEPASVTPPETEPVATAVVIPVATAPVTPVVVIPVVAPVAATTPIVEAPSTTAVVVTATVAPLLAPLLAPVLNGTVLNGNATTSPAPGPKTPAMDIPTANGTSAKTIQYSTAPVTFVRSTTSPSISLATLLSTSAKTTTLEASTTKSQPDDTPYKPAVISFNPKPQTIITSSPVSPSLTSSSPSPSPTPQKSTIKVLSAKSAGEIVITKRLEEEKGTPKQPITPPMHSRSPDTMLKRSLSVTNVTPKNWVGTFKSQHNFVKIDQSKGVEIIKVEAREGPVSPDGSDEETNNKPPTGAPPQRRFMVDKVSSSSRGTWLERVKHRDEEEEEEDEYEYIDEDPEAKHEPIFSLDFKLVSCLLRSSSSGKLIMPTLTRDKSLKRVTFKENLIRTESKEQHEAAQHKQEVPRQVEETTPTQGIPKETLDTQAKVNAQIKELEKARAAAVFHRDEMAAKYAELEQRFKEERAANEAMERETTDLHQKLATIQEHTEAKFVQKVSDITQKLADKDREILKLRMQNTTMKKKVEERDRDIERLKNTRSFSPIPEMPAEDLESDLECRQTWEKAERQQEASSKTVSVHSYGGLKISVESSKVVIDSTRSATASPRFDLVKHYAPESPFSPDLQRRTSTPPLLAKPNTPSRGTESPQVETAKSYVYVRPNPRSQTPTKVEIMKKSEGGSHHARSPSFDQLPRADSASRITYQIVSAKSPEPVKIVLSPKLSAKSAGAVTVDLTSKSGETKTAPGTPRINAENTPTSLDPKSSNDTPPKTESKPEYRPGTFRHEVSKPIIAFSPPSSPSPSPRPSPSPSPRPSPSPSPKPTTTKYIPPTRHNSNPYSPSPSSTPTSANPPRANSNPSPSSTPIQISTPSTKTTIQFGSRNNSTSSPNLSSSPSPSPSSNSSYSSSPSQSQITSSTSSASVKEKEKEKDGHTSKSSGIFSFIKRGRSNTLPSNMPGNSPGDTNGSSRVELHAPVSSVVSLVSPRGGQKIEVGTAKETATDTPYDDDDDNNARPTRIGRSYSLSAISPPKLSTTPSYIPTKSQADIKPTWLVNLSKKVKPHDDTSTLPSPRSKH